MPHVAWPEMRKPHEDLANTTSLAHRHREEMPRLWPMQWPFCRVKLQVGGTFSLHC